MAEKIEGADLKFGHYRKRHGTPRLRGQAEGGPTLRRRRRPLRKAAATRTRRELYGRREEAEG